MTVNASRKARLKVTLRNSHTSSLFLSLSLINGPCFKLYLLLCEDIHPHFSFHLQTDGGLSAFTSLSSTTQLSLRGL